MARLVETGALLFVGHDTNNPHDKYARVTGPTVEAIHQHTRDRTNKMVIVQNQPSPSPRKTKPPPDPSSAFNPP